MATPFTSGLSSYALAALRIIAGLLFLLHGTQKLFGFPAATPMGTPPIFSLLWIGAIIEIVGGALIALGFYARIAAFFTAGEMAVAYFMFHAPRGFYPLLNGGELSVLFCFVFLYIAATGPGAFAINRR